MSYKTKYLLIGNSIAGLSAAAAIRAIDKESPCTIITKEGRLPYSKPMLAHLVAGELLEKGINFMPDSVYSSLNLEILENKKVTSLDSKAKTVTTEDGDEILFEKALIATGSKPRALDIPGLNSEGVCCFHTYADAQKILKKHGNAKHAVLIGAGLIGVRAQYALFARGIKCAIVEMADRIMPAIMDKTGSDILASAFSKQGTEVLLNRTVTEIITEKNRVMGVITSDGKTLPCDLVLLTAGVSPEIDFIVETDIKRNRGILVDNYLRTSVKDIYAAGDVVEFDDFITGEGSVNANWPNASIQGRLAGANMAGEQTPYKGSMGMNSIEVGKATCVTMGLVNPKKGGYKIESHSAPENNLYKKLVFRNGKLVGAILIGPIDQAGFLLKIINDKIDVSGIEKAILKEGREWFELLRNLNRKEMEGAMDWPDSVSSSQHYEKRFNEEKWQEREEGRRKW